QNRVPVSGPQRIDERGGPHFRAAGAEAGEHMAQMRGHASPRSREGTRMPCAMKSSRSAIGCQPRTLLVFRVSKGDLSDLLFNSRKLGNGLSTLRAARFTHHLNMSTSCHQSSDWRRSLMSRPDALASAAT